MRDCESAEGAVGGDADDDERESVVGADRSGEERIKKYRSKPETYERLSQWGAGPCILCEARQDGMGSQGLFVSGRPPRA